MSAPARAVAPARPAVLVVVALLAGPAAAAPATEVVVRLEEWEGRDALVVGGAGAQPIEIARAGDALRCSDGARGRERALAPAAADGRLELGGRRYRGELRIALRPEGGLRVRNLVDLEDYVRGVVASELAIWSAPPALLEAQAVAARSYALATVGRRAAEGGPAVLSDSVLDQAYRGDYAPGGEGYSGEVDRRLGAAMAATRGRVLSHQGRVVDARFHAACGGWTASFAQVFPEVPDPGVLPSMPCPPCLDDARARVAESGWSATIGADALARLGRALGESGAPRRLSVAATDAHGRWVAVGLDFGARERRIPAVELRRMLGWRTLPGTRVTALAPAAGEPITGDLVVHGRGRGHGVGLCQSGARVLAERGWSAPRILAQYYPGAELRAAPAAGASR